MGSALRKSGLFVVYLYHRFFDEGCAHRAAALAYATLLSLVPLMMIGFTVLALFPVFKGVGAMLQNFILANFVAASANVISDNLSRFLNQLRVLSWTNVVSLFLVSILLIYNMVNAFNSIWHVKMKRHFALSFVIYLVVLLITPVLFGVLMIVSSYLASMPLISSTKLSVFLRKPLLILLPYLAAFVTFTFLNWILPSCKVRWRHALIAGLVTTVFFELAKYLFTLYMTYFTTYRLIYGALATIPIFLIWMYVSWTIILMGALICNASATGVRR